MRTLIPILLVCLSTSCGVPGGKSLSDLDANDRESICADVPKETAVCDGIEVNRGAGDCEVILASVGAQCDVTVSEFRDALDGPICAYLQEFDNWGPCFESWVNNQSNETNNVSNQPNNDSNQPNNDSNQPNNDSNQPNNDSNEPNNTPNNVSEFDPQFLEVVEIHRQNCALGGCHGNPPGSAQVHILPAGQNATPEEVEAMMSQTLPAPSGNRLIEPGAPERSEIYVRVTKPEGDLQLMGAGTYGASASPLRQQEIDTIRQWIEDGANYRQ